MSCNSSFISVVASQSDFLHSTIWPLSLLIWGYSFLHAIQYSYSLTTIPLSYIASGSVRFILSSLLILSSSACFSGDLIVIWQSKILTTTTAWLVLSSLRVFLGIHSIFLLSGKVRNIASPYLYISIPSWYRIIYNAWIVLYPPNQASNYHISSMSHCVAVRVVTLQDTPLLILRWVDFICYYTIFILL